MNLILKKILSLTFISTMIVIYLISCQKKELREVPIIPVASFSHTDNGTEISFENTSSGAVKYSWDFGDNTALSTDENPVHIYSEGGSFNVKLTVTSSTGDEKTTSKVLKIVPVVQPGEVLPEFLAFYNGLEVTFTNKSIGAIKYSWDFGDNSATTTEINPVHTFATAGTYTVTLTATSSVGKSEVKTLSVKVPQDGINPALLVDGGNNYFDLFSGASGTQNVGDWIQDVFNGIKPTLTRGVANPDATDSSHPLVAKYERVGTSSAADGGRYVRIYVKPSAIPLTWGERTKFSIRVYMPSANDPDNTPLERKVSMKLRTAAGASSEISVSKVLDASADDKWTTVELDLSEAVGGSGATARAFDPTVNYDRLLIQLGGENETEGRGFWYISDFVRL